MLSSIMLSVIILNVIMLHVMVGTLTFSITTLSIMTLSMMTIYCVFLYWVSFSEFVKLCLMVGTMTHNDIQHHDIQHDDYILGFLILSVIFWICYVVPHGRHHDAQRHSASWHSAWWLYTGFSYGVPVTFNFERVIRLYKGMSMVCMCSLMFCMTNQNRRKGCEIFSFEQKNYFAEVSLGACTIKLFAAVIYGFL